MSETVARVTSVRSFSTIDGGVEVEVTILRESRWRFSPQATPLAEDVPGDIREALRAWLDGAE